MRCQYCEAEFTPKNIRRRFCSSRCRKAEWQRVRDRELSQALEALDRLTGRLRRLQRQKTQPQGTH